MDGAWVSKELITQSDVQDRFAVPRYMLAIIPPVYPGCKIPINVLDEYGHRYEFCLSGRDGRYIKPVFQAEWRAFVQDREAKEGDVIYFWYEENERAGTEYCIQLFKHYLPPRPGL